MTIIKNTATQISELYFKTTTEGSEVIGFSDLPESLQAVSISTQDCEHYKEEFKNKYHVDMVEEKWDVGGMWLEHATSDETPEMLVRSEPKGDEALYFRVTWKTVENEDSMVDGIIDNAIFGHNEEHGISVKGL